MKAVVGQVLHGYEDGHVLLASSVELDGPSADLMLLMSDLSPADPTSSRGWLTAYPLPSTDAYIVARTWPAPEMRRPGCVWTHSLIFDYASLGSRRSFAAVIDLFRRPNSDFQTYRRPLLLPEDASARPLPRELYAPARQALARLYGEPGVASVVCEDEVLGERLAVALWEQQWPRLRRRLRWATAAMNPSTAVPEFDFVVSKRLHEGRQRPPEPVRQGWSVAALSDLRAGGSAFRLGLRDFAIDISQGRRAFPLLASTLVLTQSAAPRSQEVAKLLALFAQTLPREGALAKSRLLSVYLTTGAPLSPTLLDIAGTILPELPRSGAETSSIAMAYWRTDRAQFWTTIENLFPEAASGVLRQVSLSDLLSTIHDYPEHLSRVLELRPEICVSAEAWAISPTLKTHLLEYARHDKKLRTAGLRAAFETEDLTAARSLVAGASAIPMLELLVSKLRRRNPKPHSLSNFEHDWLRTAAEDLDAVRSYLEAGPGLTPVFIALARELGPTAFEPGVKSNDVWYEAWNNSTGPFPPSDGEFIAAFFLMRSCRYRTEKQAKAFAAAANTLLNGMEKGFSDPQAERIAQDLSISNIFNPFEARYRGLVRGLATWVGVQLVPIETFVAEAKARYVDDLVDELRWKRGGQEVILAALHKAHVMPKRRREILERARR